MVVGRSGDVLGNTPMIKAETAGRARGDIIPTHRDTSGKKVQRIKGVSGTNIRRHQGHLLMRSHRDPDE